MSEPTTATYLGVHERWLTTGLLGIGLIVFAIEASVSNYTLPKIMTSLRVELYQIHWVLTAFGIARTVIIPMLGWLSGRLGPRLLYIMCLGMFCVGALGSSLAWDWGSLLLFRVLAGLAGGLIQPLTMAIFYQISPPPAAWHGTGFLPHRLGGGSINRIVYLGLRPRIGLVAHGLCHCGAHGGGWGVCWLGFCCHPCSNRIGGDWTNMGC